MNRIGKYLIFLLLIFIFFSCEDFFNRYDPVDAGGLVFELKDFTFWSYYDYIPPAYTLPYFYVNAYGEIDNNSRSVKVTVPPSFNFSSALVTAELNIENVGLKGDEEYWINENRNWYKDSKIKLTKDLVGYTGDEETFFDPEYEIKLNKRLTASIEAISADSTNDIYPYNYLFTDNPIMYIIFNDLVNLASLDSSDFTANYSLNAPTLNYDTHYQVEPASLLSEGYYSIQLDEESCEASTSGYYNEASNVYTFAYDANAPTVGSQVDLSGSDFSATLTTIENLILKVTYGNASDTLTPDSDLKYKLCYSTIISDVSDVATMYYTGNYIPVNGKEWFSYNSPLTFGFDDLPYYFQSDLILYGTGQTYYLNIIVRDNCTHESRSNVYATVPSTNITITYNGPVS